MNKKIYYGFAVLLMLAVVSVGAAAAVGSNYVDDDEDGACDNFVDEDGDGINDDRPRNGNGKGLCDGTGCDNGGNCPRDGTGYGNGNGNGNGNGGQHNK